MGYWLHRNVVWLGLALIAIAVSPDLRAASGHDRGISLYNIHTKETLTVTYKKDGKLVPAALDQINWIMRDWRRDEVTLMDPDLVDLLWEIHAELGSQQPIHIISAFRSRATNTMLRKTVGGQASESRHILGKAADVHFPDVPLRQIRYSALIREKGGVGYYPTSATPFVHVDTDAVRHWPRLPRPELALLFPNGVTRHQPADGGPITKDDVKVALASDKGLAAQVAEFHTLRVNPQPMAPRFAMASAGPPSPDARMNHTATPAPKLVAEPRLAARRSTGLASGVEPGWVAAAAYDEEHPDELSYRPFPVAPLLTATASADDPVLADMRRPDVARTLEYLDHVSPALPTRLRPGLAVTRLILPNDTQAFRGKAINPQAFAALETGTLSHLAPRTGGR